MAVEGRLAVRWAIQRLNATGALTALIAGGAAYRRLPRAADTASKPGVAVGMQSASPPTGALRSGARTYSEQTVTIRVQTQQQTASTSQIEAVEAQVLAVLDGQGSQATADGLVYECQFYNQMPDIEEDLDDQIVIMSTLWFLISVKAS